MSALREPLDGGLSRGRGMEDKEMSCSVFTH